MAFGGIQFGGLASGLDTSAIIDALLSVERNGVAKLQSRKSQENSKLSLIGSLEGMVNSLKAKAQAFSEGTDFFAHQVSLSEENYVSVSVDGAAAAGSHEIQVNALALASRWHSSAFDDSETDLGAGTISFDYGSQTYDVSLADADSSSLEDVAEAFNDQVGDVLTATVINTGPANDPSYELVLTGRETGADAEIENVTVSGLDGQGILSFSQLQAAENAEFVFDGITVTRDGNVVTDLLDGYEITLEQVSSQPIVVSAELDTEATLDNLQELVDEYNEVVGFINEQNEFSPEAGAQGELFGDLLLSQVRSKVYNGLFDVDIDTVQADTTGYSTLGLIGFDVGTDGTITIDQTKAAEKLVADPTAFADLLTGDVEYPAGSGETVSGAFGKLAAAIDELVGGTTSSSGQALDGLFDSRKTAIKDRIALFDRQIEDEEYRLEKLEESLVAKFSALEELMAGLQSQQMFLQG